MSSPVFHFKFPTINKECWSEFETWCAGFDACSDAEQFSQADVYNPHIGQRAALWQSGFDASRRVTQLKNL